MALRKDAPLLIQLAEAGDLAGVTESLSRGADANVADWSGRTPLIYAAFANRVEIVRALLDGGAKLDIQDKDGWSALHAAAQQYSIDALRLLLERGAKVDVADFHGNTPLGNAVFHSRARGEAIALLLAAGADRNRKNNYGMSPLALAGVIEDYDVAQFLK